MKQTETVLLELTRNDVELLLNVLNEHPMPRRVSQPIFHKIITQADEQLFPNNKP